MPTKNHRSTLCFAFLAALMIHLGAIYWLYDLSWELFPVTPLIENQMSFSDEEQQKKVELERTWQLTQALNQLIPQKKSELSFDEEKIEGRVESGYDELDMDQTILESNDALELIALNDPVAIAPSVGSHQGAERASINSTNSTSSVYNELMHMTAQQHGEVAMEPLTDHTPLQSVKVGGEDATVITHEGGHDEGHDAAAEHALLSTAESLEMVHGNGAALGLAPKEGNGMRLGPLSALSRGDIAGKMKSIQQLHGHGDAGNIAKSDDFSLQVEYAPKADGEGFIFRLKLTPKENAIFRRIRHNVYFMIDRSHSIRQERFNASKWAVMEALTLMQPGDSFNVLVFDDKVVRLSKENMVWNEQNVTQAYEFLVRQPYGGLFATTDLYSSLGDIVPEAVKDKEVNTAILLSDGDTYLSIEKQQSAIGQWTKHNAGKMSLYSVASGSGNHLALLDLLSSVNKGSLHYAARDEELPNLMHNLMQALQNPIGKEIRTAVVAGQKRVDITLFPAVSRLPNMYERTPYVVYGTIDQLEDFHVFFQGKYYDKWLDIKQQVSFKKAKLIADSSLEKLWAMQQAYDSYEKYLRNGDILQLQYARRLLMSYKLSPPF